jgi:hypothetical protein
MGLTTLSVLYNLLSEFKEQILTLTNNVYDVEKLLKKDEITAPELTALHTKTFGAAGASLPPIVGIAPGVTPLQFSQLLPASTDSEAIKTVKRQLIRKFSPNINNNVLKAYLIDMFESLFNHAKTLDGLVDFNIESKRSQNKTEIQIKLDHSRLREMIYSTFNTIKQYIEKYRGILPDASVKKYIEKDTFGSLYWLEKNLINNLIEGKVAVDDYVTLDKLGPRIQMFMDYASTDWTVNQVSFAPNYPLAPVAYQEPMNEFISRSLLYCDNGFVGYLNGPVVPILNNDNIHSLLFNNTGQTVNGVLAGGHWTDYSIAAPRRHDRLYKADKNAWEVSNEQVYSYKGLILMFNKLLANYINQIYDNVIHKVYHSAINEFANGAFSDSVLGNNYIADDAALTPLAGIDKGKLIYKSIAMAIKHLITDKIPKTENLYYMETNIANLPHYLKERYRANLPVIAKLFKYFVKRVDFARNFIKATPETPAMLDKAIGILDRLESGANALLKCINTTLQDLNDTPKYLETYKDFIADYEASNGRKPFMPLSTLSYYLFGTADDLQNGGLFKGYAPIYSLGEDGFKILYGTRGVLNKEKSTLDELPGMKQILTDHNNSTDVKFNLDTKVFEKFTTETVQLIKYIVDAKFYRNYLSTKGWVGGIATIHSHIVPNVLPANIITNPTYQTPKDLINNLRLTENTFQREERAKIVESLQADAAISTRDRKAMLVFNIIDLNIVPINLHALMREVPLINLYNYSYTVDKLITEVFGLHDLMDENKYKFNNTNQNLDSSDALKLYGLMLLYPYHAVKVENYESYFSRIMRGALGVEGLERPRYLSDQIYSKALFGEVYESKHTHDEAGPPFGHAHGEGKLEVIANKVNMKAVKRRLLELIFDRTSYVITNIPSVNTILTSVPTFNTKNYETSVVDTIMQLDTDPDITKINISSILSDVNPGIAIYKKLMFLLAMMLYSIINYYLSRITMKDNITSTQISGIVDAIYDDSQNIFNSVFNSKIFVSKYKAPLWFDNVVSTIGSITPGFFTNVFPLLGINPATTHILDIDIFGNIDNNSANNQTMYKLSKDAFKNIVYNIFGLTPAQKMATKSKASRYFPASLHFLDNENKNSKKKFQKISIQEVPINPSLKAELKELGYLRFNTKFIRNIVWLANIQRVMRLKLSRDLRWYSGKVVSENSLLASSITEAYDDDNITSTVGYDKDRYY